MILRYSRLTAVFFIAVSLGVGIPFTWVLTVNSSLSESGWRWFCWAIVSLGALIFVRGAQLLVAPPTVLALTPEGIHIHFKASNGGFTKDSDLLPWRLIDGAKLTRLQTFRGGHRAWIWTIELALSSPPPFDVRKRDAIQRQENYSPELNHNRFYIITSGFFDISKEGLLAALESGRHQWSGGIE